MTENPPESFERLVYDYEDAIWRVANERPAANTESYEEKRVTREKLFAYVTALQTALAEARERLRECQSRLVAVLLQQSISDTAETRRRLFESENIPAELWEMRLR